MKTLISISVGVVLLAIATILYLNNMEKDQQLFTSYEQPIPTSRTQIATGKINLPQTIEMPVALSPTDRLSPDILVTDEEPEKTINTPTQAWLAPHYDAKTPAFNVGANITEKRQVAFNTDTMNSAAKGDTYSLPMPNGEEYVAEVEKVTTFKNGASSWQGHLQQHGDQYPVVFTVGKNSTHATITTPDGSYSLESVNGSGWVYKNPEINELSDSTQEDALIIPQQK